MADYVGHGTTLAGVSTGTIGKILRMSWDGINAGVIDVTDFDSTNKFIEKIAGLKDATRLNVDIKYDKTLFNTVEGAIGASNENWTVTLPDSSTLVCSGFIQDAGRLEVPLPDKVTSSLVIELSGEPTFTPAA